MHQILWMGTVVHSEQDPRCLIGASADRTQEASVDFGFPLNKEMTDQTVQSRRQI